MIVGVLAGLSSTLFLFALEWATKTRDQHSELIWFLPVSGLCIGWFYYHWAGPAVGGSNLIIDEIQDPKNTLPTRMVPLIFGGTILTHLFGGSAGREGTAVQLGASLADQLSRFFKIAFEKRSVFLAAGAGAGFGAAIGTPVAGIIFGMEMIRIGRIKLFAVYECTIASVSAYSIATLLRAPHSRFIPLDSVPFSWQSLFWIGLAGIAFGQAARVFIICTHFIEVLNRKFISYPPFRPFFAGIVLITLYYWEGSYQYVGLGLPVINNALLVSAPIEQPFFKTIFTSITIGSGFKGGEFVPLVFIGTTLGSFFSSFAPVSSHLFGAIGFAAVFAGAANTPIACTVMAIELFGYAVAPYALFGCFISYFTSGHKSIYSSQILHSPKPTHFLKFFFKH